jgi:hypothetical protein
MSDLGNWSAAAASVNNTLALASGTAGTSTIDGVAGVFSAADIARSRLLFVAILAIRRMTEGFAVTSLLCRRSKPYAIPRLCPAG